MPSTESILIRSGERHTQQWCNLHALQSAPGSAAAEFLHGDVEAQRNGRSVWERQVSPARDLPAL